MAGRRKKVVPAEERNAEGKPRHNSGPSPNLEAIEVTRDLWLRRVRPTEIKRRVAEQCGITEDTALDYIRRVRAEFAPHTEEERAEEVEQLLAALEKKIARFEHLAELSLELDPGPFGSPHGGVKEARENERQAVECLREIAKLRGLYAAKKVDVTVTSGVLVVGTTADTTADDWAAKHAVQLSGTVTTTLAKERP